MEKRDYRIYIQIRTFLGQTPTAIHQDLVAFAGEDAVTYPTVLKWHKSFSENKMDIEDKPRLGRPVTALTEENIDLIRVLIEDDPHCTYEDLVEASELSHGTIERIIKDRLQMTKVASRWVPHFLTLEQKRKRVEICQQNLEKIESGQWRLGDIVTGDETWIYFRNIGHKQSNRSWIHIGGKPQTIVRRGKFEERRLYCFFFRASGWVAVHALAKGQTIDHNYYIDNCLKLVAKSLRKDRPKSSLRGLKLHHDNARPHINPKVNSYLKEEGFQIMPHPPYSPDLAPSDFWLNDYIKSNLADQNDEDSLFNSVTDLLNNIPEKEFRKTFEKLVERMHLCIKNKGDYFEHLNE